MMNTTSRTLSLALLTLTLGLGLAGPAWAQQIRVVSVTGVGERSTVFFTAHLSGEVSLGPAGASIRPRMARPEGGMFDAPWQEPYEISWSFGDGTPKVNTGERPNISHVFQQQGTYTVTVEMSNRHGTISTHSREVTLNNVAPSIWSIGL